MPYINGTWLSYFKEGRDDLSYAPRSAQA